MGKTKVFLRYWHVDRLNQLARPRMLLALALQRVIRGMHGRTAVRKLYQAAVSRRGLAERIRNKEEVAKALDTFSYPSLLSLANTI